MIECYITGPLMLSTVINKLSIMAVQPVFNWPFIQKVTSIVTTCQAT